MTFGNGVRKILKDRGLNQNQFAEMLGKSPQNLSKLLKMDRPTMKTVEQMAKALNLEPLELIQSMADKGGLFRFYVETGGEQEDIESPYERLLKYAEQRNIDVAQLSEKTGIPLPQLHKNSTKKLIIPEGIVWGIRKLYPDLNITWLLQGSGGMLQSNSGDDELTAVKLHQAVSAKMGKALTKLSEWTGVDAKDISSFVTEHKAIDYDANTNIETAWLGGERTVGERYDGEKSNSAATNIASNLGGMRQLRSVELDEESKMERLIRNKADELVELERNNRGSLPSEVVIELYKRSMRDFYQLAKLESTRVKFFGDTEFIKSEGTTRIFSLGQGAFLLLTILVKENETKQYISNCQNLEYLSDFTRYVVTTNKLHFDEYRSFEVGPDSIGGACQQHITPGYIVTGKKLNRLSGRQMEFIEGSECVLVLHERIIFTQIIEWNTMKESGLYDDPQKGATQMHVNDLLEIYTIEIVTQASDVR